MSISGLSNQIGFELSATSPQDVIAVIPRGQSHQSELHTVMYRMPGLVLWLFCTQNWWKNISKMFPRVYNFSCFNCGFLSGFQKNVLRLGFMVSQGFQDLTTEKKFDCALNISRLLEISRLIKADWPLCKADRKGILGRADGHYYDFEVCLYLSRAMSE